MHKENDPGIGPLVGTEGNSKRAIDASIDALAIVLSGALPAAAPYIVGGATYLKGVGTKLQEHQDRNIQLMVAVGQDQAGLEFDEFLDAITSNPERLLPFVSACEAARRTALDDKVKALGRAVGDLSVDDSLVDESTIWIDIFSRVDAPHVRMINALAETDPENTGHLRLWKRNELREKCGLTATVSVLISTITSLGLMREFPYAELDMRTKARWSANPPGSGSPLYGKGPLTDAFLQKLKSASNES